MDKITQYEQYIIEAISEYQPRKYVNLDAENYLVLDKENKQYMLVTVGWEGYKYIHACTLHLAIINNKIWVQRDQTERGIAHRLLEFGVPKQDIVLGYHDEMLREVSGLGIR